MKPAVFVKAFLKSLVCVLAFSMLYSFPELNKHETSAYSFVNEILIFAKGMNGYGILWTFLGLFLICFFLRTEELKEKQHMVFLSGLAGISILFGIMNTAGLYLHYADALPVGHGPANLLLALTAIAGWSILFYHVSLWGLSLFHSEIISSGTVTGNGKLFLRSFILILACWLPWIISYYPASMDNDVFFQLDSVLGYIPRSNQHPWFSSVVLTGCYRIGAAAGNENAGIFLYILLRDIILALIYARGILLLKNSGMSRKALVPVLLFYAVTPVWGAYAKHAFKDTFAAGLFCWFIICLCSALMKEKRGEDTLLSWIEAGAAGTLASLFRNNFIYAVLPAVFSACVYLLYRKKAVKAILFAFCSLLCIAYNRYIFTCENVAPGPRTEALSIPFQQTARVVAHHREELTEQQLAGISCYWDDLGFLEEKYNPILSDPVKNNFRVRDDRHGIPGYLRLWSGMFHDYPQDYFEAAIAQSYGYYAFTPKRRYWEGNWNSNMVIFDWIGSNYFPSTEIFDLHYIDALEPARRFLHVWTDVWDKLPILSLTDTIAFYTWLCVLVLYELIRKKRGAEMIPVISCLLLILTCMASPVNDCFRYYAPVAVSVPVLLSLVI